VLVGSNPLSAQSRGIDPDARKNYFKSGEPYNGAESPMSQEFFLISFSLRISFFLYALLELQECLCNLQINPFGLMVIFMLIY